MAGLRESKKTYTRRALSDATRRLASERGMDNITREDIAALAGVSARTFGNYFATKYDALVYRQTERLHRSVALLRQRPAGEALWTSIAEAMLGPIEEDFAEANGDENTLPTLTGLTDARNTLVDSTVRSAWTHDVFDDFTSAIADRTGTDPRHDVYPRLVAGVIRAVGEATTNTFATADPPVVAYPTLLRAAFADVAAGLPVPTGQEA